MCGHVNGGRRSPELAVQGCGQEPDAEHCAARLGPMVGGLRMCHLCHLDVFRGETFLIARSWLCRAGKERKKADRYALDCQERAYWLVNRTPVSRGWRCVAFISAVPS